MLQCAPARDFVVKQRSAVLQEHPQHDRRRRMRGIAQRVREVRADVGVEGEHLALGKGCDHRSDDRLADGGREERRGMCCGNRGH